MVNAPGTLGPIINSHVQHYYAWRFRCIRLKRAGDRSEATEIASASSKFTSAGVPINRKLAALQADEDAAELHVLNLKNEIRDNEMGGEGRYSAQNLNRLRGDLHQAKVKRDVVHQNFLREKARKVALPDMNNFQAMLDLYDRQLMLDAQAILDVVTRKSSWTDLQPPFTRADLRPHYRMLVEAYEAEFVHHQGLTDKTIIHFFDEYIHDSLAGFGSDATLPSDPRVVYLGGNEKLAYASRENDETDVKTA